MQKKANKLDNAIGNTWYWTYLISTISTVILANGAIAMPDEQNSAIAASTSVNSNVSDLEIEAKIASLSEPKEITTVEPNAALKKVGLFAETGMLAEGDRLENSRLEIRNRLDLQSSAIASNTPVFQLSEFPSTDSAFSEPKVAETDAKPNLAVNPSDNTKTTLSQAIFPEESTSSDLEPFNNAAPESDGMDQLTSVSQLSDVQPTDWAFSALQNLVERYRCIAGYPDGTYRGNRAMTRYEFAAGLNACMEAIYQLVGGVDTSLLATKEDLAILQRLIDEFAVELATVRGRVDVLEARTTELEANQFSTTTKLFGNLRVQARDYFSGDADISANFQYNLFLGFLTSFTGRDLLLTSIGITNTEYPELINNNAGRNVGSTREGSSDTMGSGSSEGIARLIGLQYQFPLTRKLSVNLIAANRYRFDPFTIRQFLPYYRIGQGPTSTFAETPPLYLLGAGAGATLTYELFDHTVLNLTYLATFGNESKPGSGFFNGDYIAAAQINYNPSPRLFLQGIYHHGYFSTRNLGPGGDIGNFAFNNGQFFRGNGFVGSALANRFDDGGVFFDKASAVSSNSYLIGGYYALSPKFILGGWVNLINARLIGKGDANIWTYSVQAAFPDLFKKGNVGGLVVGMEPTLTGLRRGGKFVGGFENDTSLHVEAYYNYKLTENISITPSVIWITAPNQDARNQDIVIGGVRTTFDF